MYKSIVHGSSSISYPERTLIRFAWGILRSTETLLYLVFVTLFTKSSPTSKAIMP